MPLQAPLLMMGAPGSPYTRKMRAVLRFRRIPFRFIQQHSPEAAQLPGARVPLLPTFYLPAEDETASDEEALMPTTDSTPLIRRFERAFPERSVIPPHPALAFLDELLEDYADEWLTKCMFHYRWYHAPDATKARRVLPHWGQPSASNEEIAPLQKLFGERQIGRLGVVGSNDITAPVIEASYRSFLAAFDQQLQSNRFLFGGRPASADFALTGQLTCLALFDPTPSALTADLSPRIYAWTEVMEDLSGIEPSQADWQTPDALPDSLRGLLAEVGRYHVPFLLANAEAVDRKAERLETEIDGRPWVQKPFPYQRKCLGWLQESYARLAVADRRLVDDALEGTGCERLVHSDA